MFAQLSEVFVHGVEIGQDETDGVVDLVRHPGGNVKGPPEMLQRTFHPRLRMLPTFRGYSAAYNSTPLIRRRTRSSTSR